MPAEFDVLLVGSFHFGNPGRDMGNVEVDDVLAASRQAEIHHVVQALARFEPTKVAVEVGVEHQARLGELFDGYCSDTRELGRQEFEQLGFRVARQVGATVHAVDVEDVFYDPAIDEFLEQHPHLKPHMERMWAEAAAETAAAQAFLATHTLGEALRQANSPDELNADLRSYIDNLVPIGDAERDEYPGPDMVAYWYRRNFKIASNVNAVAADGDRILLVYGAGHIPVLEHIFSLMSSARVVPTLDYLP